MQTLRKFVGTSNKTAARTKGVARGDVGDTERTTTITTTATVKQRSRTDTKVPKAPARLSNSVKVDKALNGDGWDAIKTRLSPAVVAIEMIYPRPFGFASTGHGMASGFVVDKEKGILLTNKHVITDGPIRATAEFLNNEKVDLVPIYRDPIHDFGFFRFDPNALSETPLVEIPLAPEKAKSELKVLVFGNNAGEKLTYVDSTLGRMDKTLELSFIGINTFFISATDITVPGASGGPVVNIHGEAVAITCAGVVATNSSYYLPLQRVVRALKLLKEGAEISRGTIEVGFSYKSHQELLRTKMLPDGPSEITLEMLAGDNDSRRSPGDDSARDESSPAGRLVVHKILPGGSGMEAGLVSGDVLEKINGEPISDYVQLLDVMDNSVGCEIHLTVFRSREVHELSVRVKNLENINPSEFVEVSGAVVHSLEYRVALSRNLPIKGVFVAAHGYMFEVMRPASGNAFKVITGIGEHEVTDLDSFEKAVASFADGTEVSVRYFSIYDQSRTLARAITIDKHWYPFRRAKRNDRTGKWDFMDCIDAANTRPGYTLRRRTFADTCGSALKTSRKFSSIPFNAIVTVRFNTPIPIDGNISNQNNGAGVIVDPHLGLVVVGRQTVPSSFGDIDITFNGLRRVQAVAVFIHPTSLFSIIRYRPDDIAEDKLVHVSHLPLSSRPVNVGDKFEYITVTSKEKRLQHSVELNRKLKIYIGSSAYRPSFTPRNVECFGCDISSHYSGGAFVHPDDGSLRGFDFLCADNTFRGICASQIEPHFRKVREALIGGKVPPSTLPAIPVQLSLVSLVDARSTLHLPDNHTSRLMDAMDHDDRTVLSISRIMVNSESHHKLYENDLLLSVNGKAVADFTTFRKETSAGAVSLEVLRNGQVVNVPNVKTTELVTVGTQRVLIFTGMVLQPAHLDLTFLGVLPDHFKDGGVYVTDLCDGSPLTSSRNKPSNCFIIQVNDTEVTCLDEFVDAVGSLQHDEYVNFTCLDLTTHKESYYSVRLDLEYWQTREYQRTPNGDWVPRIH